jgi:hypothetical protein
MNADEMKRKSRGWTDGMDSISISNRLSIVDELYACWKLLSNAKKVSAELSETPKTNKAIATDF